MNHQPIYVDMKTNRIIHFIALAFLLHPSCERRQEKPTAIEKVAPKNPDLQKIQKSVPLVDDAKSTGTPEEVQPSYEAVQPRIPVAPATLIRLFREADEAFSNKDYSTTVAKIEELLNLVPPDQEGVPYEVLYFNIGLGKLLDNKYVEAELAFRDCIQRFPKGEYLSRCYIGLGRACSKQDTPEKKIEALEAFKKAAEDPKQKSDAELWMSRISQSPKDPQKADKVVPP